MIDSDLPPVSAQLASEARAIASLADPSGTLVTRMFASLIGDMLSARERGDYAIAAALHDPETETVITAGNELFSGRDPAGHAEMRVLQQGLRSLSDDARTTLYTTLEPCPMCAVGVLNSGVRRVVIGVEDSQSGCMLGGRLERLPPIWSHLAVTSGLRVTLASQDDPEDPEYLEPRVRSILSRLFYESRVALDAALIRRL